MHVHPKLSSAPGAPPEFSAQVGAPTYLGSAVGLMAGAGAAALMAAKRGKMPTASELVVGGALGEMAGTVGGFLRGVHARRKQKVSSLLRDEYDVSFVPDDDTETTLEGTATIPFAGVPLLRRLFDPKVHGYDGVTDAEILDALQVGGARIRGLPDRTAMGFESLHGYRPLDVHVTKTASLGPWYRPRR